jgi:hypothetical protein
MQIFVFTEFNDQPMRFATLPDAADAYVANFVRNLGATEGAGTRIRIVDPENDTEEALIREIMQHSRAEFGEREIYSWWSTLKCLTSNNSGLLFRRGREAPMKQLLMVVLVLALPCFAADKPQGSDAKDTKHGAAAKFSTSPFSGTLKPGYLGTDAQALYRALKERSKLTEKNEFETTDDYLARLKQQRSQPLIGTITVDSPVAFVLRPGSGRLNAQYSADEQKLQIVLAAESATIGFSQQDYEKAAYEWRATEKSGKYIGQNAFGATAEVVSTDKTHFGLAFALDKSLSCWYAPHS